MYAALFATCGGGLNKNGSCSLMYFNAWPIGNGTVRRCDLVGGSGSLWGWDLRSHMLNLGLMWHLLLLYVDQDTELSAASPALRLPACHHVSHHDDNGLSLCKTASIKMFTFVQVGNAISHSNKILTKTTRYTRLYSQQAYTSSKNCWDAWKKQRSSVTWKRFLSPELQVSNFCELPPMLG